MFKEYFYLDVMFLETFFWNKGEMLTISKFYFLTKLIFLKNKLLVKLSINNSIFISHPEI